MHKPKKTPTQGDESRGRNALLSKASAQGGKKRTDR